MPVTALFGNGTYGCNETYEEEIVYTLYTTVLVSMETLILMATKMCKLNKMLNILAANISGFTVDEGLGTYILFDENDGNVTSTGELPEGIFNVTDRGICVCVRVCVCVCVS